MVHLHAIWHASRLHLWGEAGHAQPSASPAARNASNGIPHPRALSPAQLHEAVGELSPDTLLASIAAEARLALWLPVDADDPATLMHDGDTGPNGAHPLELAPFSVPTLALLPADAIDFLTSMREPLARACGDSIAYWFKAASYVRALLVRKQFVPDLVQSAAGPNRACWRVVVGDEAELAWLRRFAEVMPPLCRAVIADDERSGESVELVESFLHTCADAVIRRFLEQDSFFHQIHERATADAPGEVRWLAALMSEDNRLDGDTDGHQDFLNRLRGWVGALDGDDASPMRLCFCLREPDEEEEDTDESGDAPAGETGDEQAPDPEWRVDILLQSPTAGTLHELAEVWENRGSNPGVLRRNLANRREHLRADLARAADVFPQLAGAIREPAPTQIRLTAVEAHSFLRDCAPLLEARDFGVLLPDWATQAQRQLGLRLHVRPLTDPTATPAGSVGGMGLASLVDFEWRVAVGETDLTRAEFERLRTNRVPLVRLRGEWIMLDAAAADIAGEFLDVRRSGRMTLGEAIRSAAGADDVVTGLPVVGIRGAEWIDHLLRAADGMELEDVDQPGSFVGSLRPYQQRGLSWLVFMQRIGIGACLADDMGLGKTIQLIALLLNERSNGAARGPTLVFAPMTVVGNWRREIERFAPQLRVLVHHGGDRLSGDAFVAAAAEHDVIVTTYALGHRDLITLSRVEWHRIVLDEAQKIKNPAAAQTIAIRSLPGLHRVALTGTPLENHLSELWSIMEMLNPGLLGSAARFRKRFAVPVERLGDNQRAAQLRELIRPFVLRRIKDDPDVSCDLPEKMEMQVYCNLTPEQAVLYEQVVEAALGEAESATGIRRRGVILAALTRLKQICNHPVQYLRDGTPLDGRSGKCERIVEMLEEVIAEDDAALVFTQFRQMGDLLARLLTERLHTEVLFLHGASTAPARQAMIDRFQDPASGVRIFLLSLRAGGLGLNLTAANHVFHFDRWWNPAVEAQATDRAYRIGQTRRVQVHKFVCLGTIEDRIDRMLTEKLALADRIVGSGDEWLTGLSTEELRSCLSLSRDAVGEVTSDGV